MQDLDKIGVSKQLFPAQIKKLNCKQVFLSFCLQVIDKLNDFLCFRKN